MLNCKGWGSMCYKKKQPIICLCIIVRTILWFTYSISSDQNFRYKGNCVPSLPPSMDPPVSQSICVPSLPPSQHGPTSQSVHLCALPPSMDPPVSQSICVPSVSPSMATHKIIQWNLPPSTALDRWLHFTATSTEQPVAQVIYL